MRTTLTLDDDVAVKLEPSASCNLPRRSVDESLDALARRDNFGS